MSEEPLRTLSIEGLAALDLFGERDCHLRALEERFGVRLVVRDGHLAIYGSQPQADEAALLLEHLIERVQRGEAISRDDLDYAFSMLEDRAGESAPDAAPLQRPEIVLRGDKQLVKVRTYGQSRYVEAMRRHDVVFSIGPAGTGKTFLAVAWAVHCLREKLVDRIVLVRPAVEAGESLGFLPGDLQEKVDPYLRPLYDALRVMISFEKLQRFLQLGVVEVAPLAYMRGRTLSSAFVILDEAQNTTLPQMKMFLTRLGPDSRAVITGDVTQIDLNNPHDSGLVRIQEILAGVQGVRFVFLSDRDVVRHRLVRDIILAFQRHEGLVDEGGQP
jgi:phosphate starvation-inducible PhoH-like protein